MKKQEKPDPRIMETPVTYEVYANMPDDGQRYEVADGKLELMSPGPSVPHQLISFELQQTISSECRNDYIILSTPVDVILSEVEVRQPDLVLVKRNRMHIIRKKGIFGPPDLVVEITSEHSRRRDKVHKTKSYAKHGVEEYWIVDMTNYTVEQYLLSDGRYELVNVFERDEVVQSERLTCVSFTMNDIVERLPELS